MHLEENHSRPWPAVQEGEAAEALQGASQAEQTALDKPEVDCLWNVKASTLYPSHRMLLTMSRFQGHAAIAHQLQSELLWLQGHC